MMNLGERAPMILIWTCLYVIQNTDSTIYCMYITYTMYIAEVVHGGGVVHTIESEEQERGSVA